MMLIIILLFCAFFLTFPSDVNLYFFRYFFETKIDFKKILEIKLSDKSIVSKRDERETKESPRFNFCKASDGLSS